MYTHAYVNTRETKAHGNQPDAFILNEAACE